MKFVKNETFSMAGRKFKVITGHFRCTELPKSPRAEDDVYNAVEFIEIVEQMEMGETKIVEVPPKQIPNPKNQEEFYYNYWAKVCGSNLRSKKLLYELLDDNKIVMD